MKIQEGRDALLQIVLAVFQVVLVEGHGGEIDVYPPQRAVDLAHLAASLSRLAEKLADALREKLSRADGEGKD